MRRTHATRWIALGIALIPVSAHAAVFGLIQNGIPGCDFATGMLWSTCIPNFIAHLVEFIFSLLGLFFLANVMIAGYQMAMRGITGDAEAGKRRLIWSVVGLIVSLCAFVILDLVLTVITERL